MSDPDLRAAFDVHAKETRKTLGTITNAVGELAARIDKVETGVRDAKQAAERAKMDGEGQQHAILAAFASHKRELAQALEAHTESSEKRRREDRKFYLQMAIIVMPLLSALLTRGAQEIGRPQPVPITIAAPAPYEIVRIDGGAP